MSPVAAGRLPLTVECSFTYRAIVHSYRAFAAIFALILIFLEHEEKRYQTYNQLK